MANYNFYLCEPMTFKIQRNKTIDRPITCRLVGGPPPYFVDHQPGNVVAELEDVRKLFHHFFSWRGVEHLLIDDRYYDDHDNVYSLNNTSFQVKSYTGLHSRWHNQEFHFHIQWNQQTQATTNNRFLNEQFNNLTTECQMSTLQKRGSMLYKLCSMSLAEAPGLLISVKSFLRCVRPSTWSGLPE